MDAVSDLAFFALLMKHGRLAAAAQQLGLTPPAVSKRLAALERRLGVRLLQRTTRRMSLTPEGELYLVEGERVLAELEALERAVSGAQARPRGTLRVAATLGFGRRHVAPLLSRFVQRHPDIDVQLQLTDRPVNLIEQGLDVHVRFGEVPDARLTARLLARNQRVLCAAPAYLQAAGEPTTPRELAQHRCIVIREAQETFGTWQLRRGRRLETVKVRGTLSTNDGETALAWALQGQGIVMRSLWDAGALLHGGQLQPVLPGWTLPAADIYALFPARDHVTPRVRAFVDFLLDEFQRHRPAAGRPSAWCVTSGGSAEDALLSR